jgi:hypothetical protein
MPVGSITSSGGLLRSTVILTFSIAPAPRKLLAEQPNGQRSPLSIVAIDRRTTTLSSLPKCTHDAHGSRLTCAKGLALFLSQFGYL